MTYYGWDTANAWRACQGPNSSPTQANSPVDLSYNAKGRMSSYANSDASTTANYTYDASGQRAKSVVTVGGTQTTTNFDYQDLTLFSLSATQGSTTWRIDYLYDEEGALYGGVYRSPATSTSPTYFTAVTNDHGDVLELCDADGVAFAAYRYDAWGLPQGAGNLATGIWKRATDTALVTLTLAGQIASRQVLRYASYACDAESGLYYCSARYYDPATRQWTTGDPAKADGEESAYQYCGGRPVALVDPTGEFAFAWTAFPQAFKKWWPKQYVKWVKNRVTQIIQPVRKAVKVLSKGAAFLSWVNEMRKSVKKRERICRAIWHNMIDRDRGSAWDSMCVSNGEDNPEGMVVYGWSYWVEDSCKPPERCVCIHRKTEYKVWWLGLGKDLSHKALWQIYGGTFKW
jgi:RHS repeat-associated protein